MKRKITIVLLALVLLSSTMLQSCGELLYNGIMNNVIPQNQELTAEEIYELVSPSVVEVTGRLRDGTSMGTGFFYDNNGTVITNYHVIQGCTSATITLSNGQTYAVEYVLGYSESKDIAILSTTYTSSVPLKIRRSELKTGETVYAIGSSLGLSGSLSNGIVSSAEREVDGNVYIQTTAPISSGNSGGPLLDTSGQVIGITTASFVYGQNLNLAIPISEVDNVPRGTPTTLANLFKQSVEWLSEWDFFYYSNNDQYVLVFQLADESKVPMAASGKVDIRIVNKNGVTVYNRTVSFAENNFTTWVYDGTTEKYLATIYIDPSYITKGSTASGTVYFTVYGSGYSFEQTTINAYDLPTY